ncbi:conjugal transfer protein TrbI (plasmid) [Zophobihabitans entericus]|uniref:Conjugal transfer protein TrbI n=2 Tax=Zophobihabitans entericus TaxID=1635327 RepID=A0A6G9IFE3_9GAMM|nr:TrbI/VirB10 family protein [Zophobihabitans entericus]QIQ22542.1 conjugal transfer protein TrbI [Zophobihabitans entericus]
MTDKNDVLSPDTTAKGGKVGTRRVNNKPMLIVGGVLLAFLLIMIVIASEKANQSNVAQSETPVVMSNNSNSFAQELVSSQNGIIPAELPPQKPMDLNDIVAPGEVKPITIVRPDNLDLPPIPPNQNLGQSQPDPNFERIQMAKMQLFEQSLRSKTAVNMIAPVSSGSVNYGSFSSAQNRDDMLAQIAAVRQKINANSSGASGDITEQYKQRMAMMQNSGLLDSVTSTSTAVGSGRISSGTGGASNKNKWKLDAEVEPPSSPYEIRTGFIIPGTLISGINSELPGQISAQVSQNVYDTATGRHLLIPQGARLNGTYSSEVVFGQARVMVAWERVIFPDGKALDITSMPGTDSGGYAGFNDKVNNHYMRIFGSAILLSGITAGISYSQDQHSSDDKSASGALSEALGQQLGQTTMQLVAKNMNIAPTLEIRPGYRFNIVVTKDMTFTKPYKSFDY